MKSYEIEKGRMDLSDLSLTVPIVNPRLMRLVPSNITRVIGNFEELASPAQNCDNFESL